MKTTMFAALLLTSTLAAGTAYAQPAPFNDVGVTMGHWHLASKDVEANKKIFLGMGGKLFMPGGQPLMMFPGVYINLTLGNEKGDGGTQGSVVNHVGFIVNNVQERVAQWKAAGVRGAARQQQPAGPGLRRDAGRRAHRNPRGQDADGADQERTRALLPAGSRDPEGAGLVRKDLRRQGRHAATMPPVVDLPGVQLRFDKADTAQAADPRPRARSHRLRREGPSGLREEARGGRHQARRAAAHGRRSGNTITYITDPWGTRIEIIQRAPLQ